MYDEKVMLKPSMFNYVLNGEDGMMIYNSFKGSQSIVYVERKSESAVSKLLSGKGVVYNEQNYIMRKLRDKGYLIPECVDEKCLRCKVCADILCDGTLTLVIHTTNACDFRCKYCYVDFESRIMSIEIQQKVISFVAKNINNYTGVDIAWFGGEPLLGLSVIQNISEKVMEICKRARKPYTASITTNGYRLTKEVFQTLCDNKVTSFTVTLDGLKDLHNQYRVRSDGSGTFDQIMENLIYIRDYSDSTSIQVNIRSNVTNKFLDRVEEYVKYYDSFFGNDKRFRFFIRPVSDWGGKRVKSIENELILYSRLGDVYKKIAHLEHQLDFSPSLSELNRGGDTCMALCKNKFTISVDGIISKCDEADNGNGKLAVGNLTNSLYVIDEALHSKWLYSNLLDQADCDNCFYSIPCLMGSCPKHTIFSGKHACPLNYEELNGLIQLAGSILKAEHI